MGYGRYIHSRRHRVRILLSRALFVCIVLAQAITANESQVVKSLGMSPPPLSADFEIRYDYDIVYVRVPRRGDLERSHWAEIAHPAFLDPGGDLVLLHPDGREEVLVSGGKGSVADPAVSFDGEWIYYAYFPDLSQREPYPPPEQGADIYKIQVPTRRIVRLTQQIYTPNLGATRWSKDFRTPDPARGSFSHGVLNLGPCPLPGGRLMFTSSRNGFKPPKHHSPTLQLFVMDDDGRNVEQVGYLNLGMALHPTVLTDGRVLFSSLESQGLRSSILWGLWSIHPDGTQWNPVLSAFNPGEAPSAFHFQTQLSDGHIVAEAYYNQNNNGFGTLLKLPSQAPKGFAAFGPAHRFDSRNQPIVNGFYGRLPALYRLPFSAYGLEALTPFATLEDGPAGSSVPGQEDAPRVGKFTHPSAAPDNHLLTVWSAGPVNLQNGLRPPAVDSGIYLIKNGRPIHEPAAMRLIKNDPRYNEQWPRALVPYRRIYGIAEPRHLPVLANDGNLSHHLPAGTPFALIGSSSMYKRESYPNGSVRPDQVTSGWSGKDDSAESYYRGLDPFNTTQNAASLNWFNQGADAGVYGNGEIHAVRILAMEPTTDRQRGFKYGALFKNHANERLRILGEIPVRKFEEGKQPLDPDGNPDTSFLAKLPADTAFTFQSLDKNGMVLNMAQTWHQLRPGEVRHDCGGCHAHSQAPTHFEDTRAARRDYQLFDLTQQTPLLTEKSRDSSGKRWDVADEVGLRFERLVKDVEFYRDVRPILRRSCTPCHSESHGPAAGNLVLDDDHPVKEVPGDYYRLALDYDEPARFGHKPILASKTWRRPQASRYVRMFQSRRSLLIWKIFGKRLDGWTNDDFPTETTPGDASTLTWKGQRIAPTLENLNRADLDYTGSQMPPPEAVKGTYVASDGRHIRVPPLSDEDRRTIVRWIDLGCPIDLDFDPSHPQERGFGWMLDDQRPTLTLTEPRAKLSGPVRRILLGMYDYGSGLDLSTFKVTASFAVDGAPPGTNLASAFKEIGSGIWEYSPRQPIIAFREGDLHIAVRDRQGNETVIDRHLQMTKTARPAGEQ